MNSHRDFLRRKQEQEEEERLAAISSDVKKRQRTRIRTQHIKQIISRVTSVRSFAQQQTGAQLDQAWKVVVGTEVASMTRVGSIKRGVLEITVTSSVVAQELGFAKGELVRQLQSQVPDAGIRDLRLRVGLLD